MKCDHCPLPDKCNGEENKRLCELVDPNHPDHNPSYLKVLVPPGVINKAINLIGAAVDHAKSGFENVSDEVYNYRMEICRACDSFDDPTCNLCGCHMNLKAKLSSSECPLKKWVAKKKEEVKCASCKKT